MKKVFILFAMLGLVAVSSCNKENNDKLTLDKTEITFDANGGSQTVTATANAAVTAVSDQDWCTVTVNATKVIVEVAANDAAERTATVTVSCKTAKAVLTVKQSGMEGNLDGILSEVSAPTAGGKVSIGTFTTNVEPQVTSPVDWITSEISGQEIFVNVAANTSGEERSAIVSVAAGALTKDVTVKQALDMGVTVEFEEIDGAGVGKQGINFIISLTGSADDFAFACLMPSELTLSDEEFIDILKQGGDNIYNKDIYDQAVGAMGGFVFELPDGQIYPAVALPKSNGQFGSVLTKTEVNLDKGRPSEKYQDWIGTYDITVKVAGQDKTYSISINEGVPNASYMIDGWAGVSMEATGGIAVPVVFDPATGNLKFVATKVTNVEFNDGSTGVLYFFGTTESEQGTGLITGSYDIAEIAYSTDEITISAPILDVQGEQVTLAGMNYIAQVSDGYAMITEEMWNFPMTLKKTGTKALNLKPMSTSIRAITAPRVSVVSEVMETKCVNLK